MSIEEGLHSLGIEYKLFIKKDFSELFQAQKAWARFQKAFKSRLGITATAGAWDIFESWRKSPLKRLDVERLLSFAIKALLEARFSSVM
jgi:hypothetical protein